ncbi:complement factor H [Esox lucius]|uniref:complement factor H n=1 Tax=Esox lucius TaxID=8010 RepID=UPI0014773EC5|nr:complement factor H [Esox lucius]
MRLHTQISSLSNYVIILLRSCIVNICRSSRGIQFSEEMGETKGLFFVLLVSLHGTVHAQGVTSCRKPKLDEGYFNSEENVYNEGTTLYYGCNKGRKPVAEGWWGITVCKNSQWTPEPQCIDESDCVAPDNPNAKVRKPSEEGWYKNGRSVNFECDEFYETKRTNAKCENGIWEDLPVCEKRKDLCGEPPQVKNAVITQEYRDTFLDSSSVQYKCQDSYNLNITDPTICISGIWSGIPKCIQVQEPSSAEKTDTGEEAQRPTGRPEPSGSGPFVPGEEAQRPIGRPEPSGSGPFVPGKEAQRPTGRPEPSGSGPFLPVEKCGEKPVVDNGDYISDNNRMALTYKCKMHYELEGPEQVMCHSNGVWSETPVCKAQGVTSCRKPKLDEGYFNSEENVYSEGTTLYYGCNKGRKPVTEGWWGITECKNSQWTPEPRCIDESDCLAPDNPNAKVRRPSEEGWYKNGRSVYFECDEFYETKRTAAKCENGTWEDLPVCEKRKDLCGEPPQVKNAVITQEYRDTFLDSSSVQYKCQDSYNLNITEPTICISGIWSGIPKCIQVQEPSSAEKTHTGEEAQRPIGRPEPRGSGPFVPGKEAQRPTGRPEPSGSGPFLPVEKCGEKPVVDNGDYISDNNRMALTYKCKMHYELEGPEQVMCHSNGVWSETPVCKAQGVTSCRKPKLDEGYFNSEENVYNEGTTLYYGCNKGRKPVTEGWWGITECKNSQWTPEPRCIERKDLCVEPPQVNHAVITQDYQNKFLSGSKVVYKCQTSYTLNGPESIVCISGEWTPTPTCSKEAQRPTGRPEPSGSGPFLPDG